MSKFELPINSGNLFRADKDNPDDRDYRGEINIDGKLYWLSGWVKEGQRGKYMKLSAKPKELRQSGVRPSLKDQFDEPAF